MSALRRVRALSFHWRVCIVTVLSLVALGFVPHRGWVIVIADIAILAIMFGIDMRAIYRKSE